MARLDLPDKWRDEDDSADSSVTSETLGTDVRPLAEPYQMTVQECIAEAERG